MKSRSLLLSLIVGAAIAAPLAATAPKWSVAFADQIAMPRDQAEFDQFAARFDKGSEATRTRELNRAGHAFDNGESRLFWFTDLDAARAQAKREGKPILSLRLLGNLSDEMSCANSRLFRVLLYPNTEINRQLRESFVLHWSSERPVPVATIDMGDGRVFKRTLTGNSAHYLLGADGQPLDVLPGLYAPTEFATWLQRGAEFARDWQTTKADARPKMLSDWHRERLIDGIKAQPGGTFRAADDAKWIIAANFLASDTPASKAVPARAIAPLAMAKRIMEIPILNGLEPPPAVLSGENVVLGGGSSGANSMGRTFDAATRARIAAMQPENEPQLLIQTLEQNVARDTGNNKINFEPAIHAYFVHEASPDFDKLNRAIYDKLFRTPASDPWLGLAPADAFVAIQNGGVQNAPQSQQRVAQNP